jgi:DNA polymerase V
MQQHTKIDDLAPTLGQKPALLTADWVSSTSPLVLFRLPAGFPSPAADYIESTLDLNDYLIRHKAASFLFSVQGYSMRDAGIMDGDKVVVDRAVEPQHNHIVVAVVDGHYTIKRLYRRRGCVELRPDNPEFKPICFAGDRQLEIWGVVTGVVRRYGS